MEPLMNVDELAKLLNVGNGFIYQRTARGHPDPIPHYKIGGHLRFKRSQIDQWLESRSKEKGGGMDTGSPNSTLGDKKK